MVRTILLFADTDSERGNDRDVDPVVVGDSDSDSVTLLSIGTKPNILRGGDASPPLASRPRKRILSSSSDDSSAQGVGLAEEDVIEHGVPRSARHQKNPARDQVAKFQRH